MQGTTLLVFAGLLATSACKPAPEGEAFGAERLKAALREGDTKAGAAEPHDDLTLLAAAAPSGG